MRSFVKQLASLLVRLWSHIYTYQTSLRLRNYHDLIYTLWIRNFLGELPLDSSISYPCSLQGGGAKNVFIGHHCGIQSHGILGCWVKYGDSQTFNPKIIIGNNCSIGEYNHITSCNKITIGNGLLTGRYVFIGDNSHGGLSWEESKVSPVFRKLTSKGEIVIGDNVWIGDKSTILGGVTIGDNVIVAANTVVTKNVPSNCIVAGSPARVVKSLG